MIQQLTQMLKNQVSQTRMIQLNRAVAALKYLGGRGQRLEKMSATMVGRRKNF